MGGPSKRDAGSRFDATLDATNSDDFLRAAAALAATPGAARQSTDVAVSNGQICPARAFAPFGTWRMTLP